MELNTSFHDKIAQISLDHFKALPKSGKPNLTEWTILSCIVLEQNGCFSVVALGTGSKCIGQSKMSYAGDILNDSHAEIICRRSFLRFLYSEMIEKSSLLIFDENLKKYKIKNDAKFHFFTTHVPCGDCAIFPKQSAEEFGEVIKSTIEEYEIPSKKSKFDEDIFRTGAKCLRMDQNQDSKLPGKEYHVIGTVRTKPGRGDPTLSVSCSDKITKWCYLGIQGALMTLLLDKPVYLSSFTIAGGTPFSIESLNRAFYDRIGKVNLIFPYVGNQIVILGQSNLIFSFTKTKEKQPCPCSISWCQTKEKSLEVAVEGKKQGVTKKKINSDIGRLKICKLEFFKSFISVCNLKSINRLNIENSDYISAKRMADTYQQNWIILKKKFGIWTKKNPKLLSFTVDNQKNS